VNRVEPTFMTTRVEPCYGWINQQNAFRIYDTYRIPRKRRDR